MADADVGAVEDELTTTVVLTQEVVPQTPSALSQYVVVLAGLTTGAAPEVKLVPAQEPIYHSHVAPSEPKLPPFIPKVEGEPEQIGDIEEAELGIVEEVLTTTVVLTQVVVPQLPSALSQYVVVLAGFKTGVAPEVA